MRTARVTRGMLRLMARTAVMSMVLGLATACGDPAASAERPRQRPRDAEPVEQPQPEPEVPPLPPAWSADEGPHLRVLGTAQDGGLPHAACTCQRCEAARSDPARARRIASIAVILPATSQKYLVDATPDIRPQLHALRDVGKAALGKVDRRPLDGVFVTHAHLGHYTGLAFLGFEAVHAQGIPTYATAKMTEYLGSNAPWDQLVRNEEVVLQPFELGEPVRLGPVTVTASEVPHRNEYADTVGFSIAGPTKKVLYLPDTEPWDRWSAKAAALLEPIDVAIVDGTFYSLAELPGRDVTSIGHPLMTDTMDLLQDRVRAKSIVVYFTHLNHSNPVLDPDSPERAALEERGFFVLADAQTIPL